MSSWTKQMGFPQLNVEIKSFENDCIILHLTQKKFSGKADTSDKFKIQIRINSFLSFISNKQALSIIKKY